MSAIKLLAAVYMLLVAAAVAVNFIAILFYDPPLGGGWFAYSSLSDPDPLLGDAGLTAWQILDPLMVAGVIMVLMFAFGAKRRRDSDSSNRAIDREYLEANVTFYFSGVLLLVLLWNWISSQWVVPAGYNGLLWVFIDTTLPFLLASTGIRLLRRDPAYNCSPKQ